MSQTNATAEPIADRRVDEIYLLDQIRPIREDLAAELKAVLASAPIHRAEGEIAEAVLAAKGGSETVLALDAARVFDCCRRKGIGAGRILACFRVDEEKLAQLLGAEEIRGCGEEVAAPTRSPALTVRIKPHIASVPPAEAYARLVATVQAYVPKKKGKSR